MFNRRNLNDYQRAEIALKLEDALKAQARERMLLGKSNPRAILPEGPGQSEPSNTDPFDLDNDFWGTESGQIGQGTRTDLKPADESSVKANLPERRESGRARDAVAVIAGVSGRTGKDFLTVFHEHPGIW